jgi:hypothetical protein
MEEAISEMKREKRKMGGRGRECQCRDRMTGVKVKGANLMMRLFIW